MYNQKEESGSVYGFDGNCSGDDDENIYQRESPVQPKETLNITIRNPVWNSSGEFLIFFEQGTEQKILELKEACGVQNLIHIIISEDQDRDVNDVSFQIINKVFSWTFRCYQKNPKLTIIQTKLLTLIVALTILDKYVEESGKIIVISNYEKLIRFIQGKETTSEQNTKSFIAAAVELCENLGIHTMRERKEELISGIDNYQLLVLKNNGSLGY